jgi:hypothetical protein
LNPLGELILEGISRSLSVSDVPRLLIDHPALVRRWLPQHPEWLVLPVLWQQSLDVQRRLVELVATQRSTLSLKLGDIVAAMVKCGSAQLAEHAMAVVGKDLVDLVLDGIVSGKIDSALPPLWRSTLSAAPAELLRWLGNEHDSPQAAALILNLLDPGALAVRDVPIDLWITQFAQRQDRLPREKQSSCHAFLCCLGMRNVHRRGDELLIYSFTATYWALRNGTLPAERWEQLRKALPERQSRIITDHYDCDWLLRGLVEQFRSQKWHISSLFKILADDVLFGILLGLLRELDGGKEFRKELRRFAKWNSTAVTYAQRTKLSEKSFTEKFQQVFRTGTLQDQDDDDLE